MERSTQLVDRQFNRRQSTAAHACLPPANIQATIDGLGLGHDDACVLDTFPIVRFDFTAAVGPLPQAYKGADYTSTLL